MSTLKWKIDPNHSQIMFKVKHLMIASITGRFTKFSMDVETVNESFNKALAIDFSAEVSSIDTNNTDRDTHLKSLDFFNAAAFPLIKFTTTDYEKSKNHGSLTGELTIKDITQIVQFSVEFGGEANDQYGNTRAGFVCTATISRKSFGLLWDAVTEAGGVVVSDDVKLIAEIELIEQK
ncbi:YceI family protein [Solitalea sp. MAHUQ-68]|uniref:YceI family protein n=1 Tax=Solitalea agri TaxID=2953739 RepID=A0A9X2F5B4_9SPHI|nr:YceI family protein [Solitalea agri]MCO4294510.1 YceI family protein [Solitalea agri]